jgi:hypothetical protein
VKRGLRIAVTIWSLALACPLAAAQGFLPYRDLTGTRETTVDIEEEILPDGSIMHSRMTDGELHDVRLDASTVTISYHVVSPARRIDYRVTRDGDILHVAGTFAGAPISKTIRIGGPPWYESIERSIRDYIITGETRPLPFWILNPWDATAYRMEAQSEGQEVITVNDRQVTAVRIRVSPVGLLRLFWSSLYWFRPSDGRFLRYEAVRGLPGTPKTVVEYMGTD